MNSLAGSTTVATYESTVAAFRRIAKGDSTAFNQAHRGIFMDPSLIPGALVRHSGQPDWGVGQVQSAVGWRVTVNFEHAGKRTIDTRHARLQILEPPPPPRM